MNKMSINKPVIIVGLASVLLACGNDEPAPTGITMMVDPQGSVATVGAGNLSVVEVRDYLISRPVAAQQKVTVDVVEKRIDEMVTAEVLFQEALRLKLDQQPEIRRNIRHMLAQKLLLEKIDQPVLSREISDEELKEYFEQHRLDYTRPEQMRLADIFIAVDEDATEDERAQKSELAEDVLAQANAHKTERFGFSELIRRHSDKHPKYAVGSTGFFDLQGLPVGIDSALTEAAFTLEKTGEIFQQVVATPMGYHVIMRVGSRAAIEKEYTDVRPDIDQRIRRDELESHRRAYVDEIRQKADIDIDAKLVTSLVNELQATTVQAVGGNATPGNRNSNYPPTLSPKE
jgi:peptidyl-prolyl cis-trans isomerase C